MGGSDREGSMSSSSWKTIIGMQEFFIIGLNQLHSKSIIEDGDTPRMSYSFVSTTVAMVLLRMSLQREVDGQRDGAGGGGSTRLVSRLPGSRPGGSLLPPRCRWDE
ncbi:hypothetical protein EYF80_021398 [Liparis tanakae]|uniref:Uncharacterized protein n=1 Tax=Liparis tanakae TaxID=230148 RepID=A0A4Z2HST4_9TELE|nr:hypothetical protein EYF80_021398 [Liparis tanakae]